MITVFGRLLASFFDTQAGPVPVSGRVIFTPNFTSESRKDGVHLPTPVIANLDDGGSFEVRLLTGGWSWKVEVIAKDRLGGRLTPRCFNFLPEPGTERINFAEIIPLTDPVSSEPILRGPQGVSVESVGLEGDALVFQLTDGSKNTVALPTLGPAIEPENINILHDGDGTWVFESASGTTLAIIDHGDGDYELEGL